MKAPHSVCRVLKNGIDSCRGALIGFFAQSKQLF